MISKFCSKHLNYEHIAHSLFINRSHDHKYILAITWVNDTSLNVYSLHISRKRAKILLLYLNMFIRQFLLIKDRHHVNIFSEKNMKRLTWTMWYHFKLDTALATCQHFLPVKFTEKVNNSKSWILVDMSAWSYSLFS